MTELSTPTTAPRKLWVRVIITLLLCATFQLAASVLLLLALLQLVFAAATDSPNTRLQTWGHSIGRYMAQIASFACFQTEEAPFPFSDWPMGD